MPITRPGCHLCFWPEAIDQRFPSPLLTLDEFVRMAHKTQRNLLRIRLLVNYKRIWLRQPDRRDAQGKVQGKGARLPCSFKHSALHISTCSPTGKFSGPCPEGINGGFIIWVGLIQSLASSQQFNLQPPLHGSQGVDWKFQPSNHKAASPGKPPLSLGAF